MTLAEDRDADVVEGRGDRRMRLVHGNPDSCDLAELVQHGLGNGSGRGLDQPIALSAERLARHQDHLIVADRVGKLVGARRLSEVDVERQIEREGLADLRLVLHHAVIGMQRQPSDEHLIAHAPGLLLPRMEAATRSAWIVTATSWVRIIVAPLRKAITWAASEPPIRSIGSDG